jgi:hypothetical protein
MKKESLYPNDLKVDIDNKVHDYLNQKPTGIDIRDIPFISQSSLDLYSTKKEKIVHLAFIPNPKR